ncbi:MAG TPA: amidohydrolase [Solirubrobacterales bacterium]|nr:amidohydrolase [Solirubrobacterales bacterium]
MSAPKGVALAVLGARIGEEEVGVRCIDGVIAELGPGLLPRPGEETIEARGAQLVPPLVNGHTHAAMTLFRGSGGDLPLMRWLRERIWPVEAKLEPDDVYWGTRLACAEMIRTGTTRFWDMYWHPAEVARAVADSGLRACVGAPLFDANSSQEELRESALQSLEGLSAGGFTGVSSSLAPHSIYTVSEGSLRWIAALAAERRLPIQIHLSETEDEVSECLTAHGLRPTAYLDEVGMLGERTVLAHGVWLDRAELELVAERGCTVITNPVANQKLAVGGTFPYPDARRAGVRVGLGTDGAGSNDSLDLFADLKAFALAQKQASADPGAIGAEEALAIARGGHSRLLGATPLAVGEPADFLLLRRGSPELSIGELASNLVYAASGSVVDTTVVAGRVLMRGGEVPGQEEIVAHAVESAARLGL